MDKVIVSTRSMNQHLLDVCHGLLSSLSYPRQAVRGSSAPDYLYGLLQVDAEWVVNIDEDAFVWDSERIEALRAFMEKSGYVCCGMPDGGVVPMRKHNPVVPNAFFNIIHLEPLRSILRGLSEVRNTRFHDRFRALIPTFAKEGPHSFDMFEPYYPFFLWMLEKGFKMLFLRGEPWKEDRRSTILFDHEDHPFLIHTWLSGTWGRDPGTAKRIDKAIEYCRRKCRGV